MSRIFLAATRKFRPLPFRDRQVLSLRLDDTVPEILNQLNPLSQGQLLKMLKLRCHTQILPHLSLTNKRIPRTGRSHGHADSAERTLAAAYGIKPRGYTKFLPDWPSIVDIEKPEDLADLKVRKKAWKASN